MGFRRDNRNVFFEDEKSLLRFDLNQGGDPVEWRFKRVAPGVNGLGHIWLNGSFEGQADGTGLGIASSNEKNPNAVISSDGKSVEFSGDMRWQPRPADPGPIKYWRTWRDKGGWFEETVKLQVTPQGNGLTSYGISVAADFSHAWNKASIPCSWVWYGQSRDFTQLDLVHNPPVELEVNPRHGYLNTVYKWFGWVGRNAGSLLYGDLSTDWGGICIALPDDSYRFGFGIDTGHDNETLQFVQEAPGNAFVRSIGFGILPFGDGERRFLEGKMGSTDPFYTEPNVPLRNGDVIQFRICWLPHEGNFPSSKQWIRNCGFAV
jgi:hypothetical protein